MDKTQKNMFKRIRKGKEVFNILITTDRKQRDYIEDRELLMYTYVNNGSMNILTEDEENLVYEKLNEISQILTDSVVQKVYKER